MASRHHNLIKEEGGQDMMMSFIYSLLLCGLGYTCNVMVARLSFLCCIWIGCDVTTV